MANRTLYDVARAYVAGTLAGASLLVAPLAAPLGSQLERMTGGVAGVAFGQNRQQAVDYGELIQKTAPLVKRKESCNEAIQILEPHKDSPSNNHSGFFNELGVAYRHCGRNNEAIEMYKRSISLNGEDPLPKANLALLYLTIGTPETIEEAKKLITYLNQVQPDAFATQVLNRRLKQIAQ
jgi:tetratricopeptide (TPR) repeat protein